MDAAKTHLLGMTGQGGRVAAPAPTEESVGEWTRLYEEAGSVSALARTVGRTTNTVRYHLLRHGIEVRGRGYKSPKSIRHYGPDNASWKGGTYRHSQGYIYEYAPEHPEAPKAKGYVLQHRLVMERHLGRTLTKNEVVHHRNEIKDDNRIENLEVTSRSRHMKHHKSLVGRDEQGRFS